MRPVVDRHGLDSVLEPFVKDLTILTSYGISINVDGTRRNLKGGLLCFLADNAASNSLGGFKESFSFSFRFCHSCMATINTYHQHFLPHHYTERTDSDHEGHCAEVEGPL